MAGLVPSAEGIRLVMGLEQSVVLDRISCLAGHCIEGLRDAGITVRTPIEPRHRAGVVAFDTPSAPELAEYLRSRRVDVGGYHWGLGRVDPHAFNNEEDVERFLAGVQAFQNGRRGRHRGRVGSTVATIHKTTLSPSKLELLSSWLPTRAWYRGAAEPVLSRAGGFRLDDPEGEVGMEFMVVVDSSGRRRWPITCR